MGCDHKFVDSNHCVRCGVHVDACNAQSLASMGAFTAAARKHMPELFAGGDRDDPGDDRPPESLSPDGLLQALDLLMAQYVLAHPGKLLSKTSVLELAEWTHERAEAATAAEASGGPAS